MSSSPFTRSLVANSDDIKLLTEYLEKRTLEPKDFPEGLIPMRDTDLLRQRNYLVKHACGRPFIFLRYLDPSGKPYLKSDKEPYELVRFLGEPRGVWGEKDPPLKVLSPGKRPNQLHFEPIRPTDDGQHRDWHNLPDDTVVLHVESMVKAKAVHKWMVKYPCVGLNGVYGWSASKQGIEVIHSQTGVDFSRFINVLLFDANTSDPKKPEVRKARDGLAFKLRNVLGCKDVRIAELPRSDDGEYWGPDDFLYAKGNAALDEVIIKAEPFVGSLDDTLMGRIQDKVVFCTQTGAVIDRVDKVVREVSKARELYMPINRKELVGKQIKITYAFDLWRNNSEARKTVVAPCYLYLGDEFVTKPDGEYYNLYRKSGADPAPERTGAADLVIEQLENMLDKEGLYRLRTYFKFLKFTSAKPCTFIVMHGLQRGVGKGWTTKIMDRLIGNSNTTAARGKDLSSNFNAIFQAKRLIIFNEYIHEGSWASAVNAVKGLAGDEFITIEPKGMDAYRIENRAGAIFTTNNVTDVPADGLEDRRLIYMKAENKVPVTQEQWDKLQAMIDDPEVMEDFACWLMESDDVNYSTWRPDPFDASRRETLLGAAKGLEGALMNILERLRTDEEGGWICARIDTIQQLLAQDGWADKVSNQYLSGKLGAAGWVASSIKNYGGQGFQRCVWLLNVAAFEPKELDRKWVLEECARLHAFVTGLKVDIKKF